MTKPVFNDLYASEEAFVLEQKAKLLSALETWLKQSGLNQTQAAVLLGIDQPRVSDISKGKMSRFTIDKLLMLTHKAGIAAEVTIGNIADVA